MVGPAVKREAVAHLRTMFQMSERRACSVIAADRTSIRYQFCRPPDTELRCRLRDLANARRRFGYRRLFVLLRQQGEPSGINRIYRLYREEGLTVRRRRVRRRAVGARVPILIEAKVNARWSLDFVHDQFACGRRFRILNIVDAGMSGGGPRHLDLRQAGGTGTEHSAPTARQARHDRIGSWDRTHLECHPRLVCRAPHRLALHRPG